MKSIKNLLLFTLLLGISPLPAQKIALLKFGATMLGLRNNFHGQTSGIYPGASLSFEYQLGSKTSLGVNGSWNARNDLYYQGHSGNTSNLKYIITSIEPEIRYYPNAATRGWYVGGTMALYFQKTWYPDSKSLDDKHLRLGTGLTTGYQFRLTRAWHLQIGGGVGTMLPDKYLGTSLRYNFSLLLGYRLLS